MAKFPLTPSSGNYLKFLDLNCRMSSNPPSPPSAQDIGNGADETLRTYFWLKFATSNFR